MHWLVFFLVFHFMPAEAAEETAVVRYAQVIHRPPEQQSPTLKVWTLRRTDQIRVNLVTMTGEQRLHRHPDAAHSLLVFSGRLKVRAGDQQHILRPGDFISIPAGTAHKYWSLSAKTVLVSMDAPYYDPRKTVVLE